MADPAGKVVWVISERLNCEGTGGKLPSLSSFLNWGPGWKMDTEPWSLLLGTAGPMAMAGGSARLISPAADTVNSFTSLSPPPDAHTVYGPVPVTCKPIKNVPATLYWETTFMVAVSTTESEYPPRFRVSL